MALKTILQSLDGVDDAVQSLYVEQDGAFVLDLEGIDQHPEVVNLRTAHERVKADRDAIRQERDTARADLANATKGKPDEAALIAERQQYEAKITDLTGKLDEANGKIASVTRDTALKTALTEAGISNPVFVKAATAMLRDQIKMDGENPVVEGAMGPKPLADFVKGWAASDEGKAFVSPPAGGGAKGAEQGGQKPLSEMGDAERLELARQGKLKAVTGQT